MVDGRDLLPSREGVDACWHRPPHPPGPGPVLGWPAVVDPSAVNWGDHGLDPVRRPGDVEVCPVQLRDGTLGQLLHPGAEVLPSFDAPARVAVQDRHGLLPSGSRPDEAADPCLFGAQPGDLLPAPGVGFVQVHGGAEEVPRGPGVDLGPAGVLLPGQRQQLAGKEGAEPGRGGRRRAGGRVQLAAQRVRDPGQPPHQPGVEGVPRLSPVRALLGDLLDLQPGRGRPFRAAPSKVSPSAR